MTGRHAEPGTVLPSPAVSDESPSDAGTSDRNTSERPRPVPDVRHYQEPNPDGCQWCGDDRSAHGRSWEQSAGMHGWEPPTRDQRLARMTARRARRART